MNSEVATLLSFISYYLNSDEQVKSLRFTRFDKTFVNFFYWIKNVLVRCVKGAAEGVGVSLVYFR